MIDVLHLKAHSEQIQIDLHSWSGTTAQPCPAFSVVMYIIYYVSASSLGAMTGKK